MSPFILGDYVYNGLPVTEKLMMVVWCLANGEAYRVLSRRFAINQGTVHYVVMKTLKVTFERLDVSHFRLLNECDEKKFVFDLLATALPYRLIKNYTSHQFYLVKKEREKKVRRLLLEKSPLYWLRNLVT